MRDFWSYTGTDFSLHRFGLWKEVSLEVVALSVGDSNKICSVSYWDDLMSQIEQHLRD